MDHPQRHLLPFLAALAGVGFLSLMDVLMKSSALVAGVYTASLLRSLLAAAMVAPIWLASGFRWPRGTLLRLHVERGVLSAFMALSWFFALTRLPVAEAIAISFVAPLIALYLARVLLGETITRQAILASLLGFAGTLVIVGGRIGSADFTADTALGLASLFFSALLYAYNFILMRKQAQLAGPLEIATFHGGVAGLVQALAIPWLFVMPAGGMLGSTVGGIAVSAMLTAAGAMALAWAYRRAEAQVLVPVEYSGFLWTSAFAWMLLRETVTVTTIAGVVLIVAGCWIAVPRRRRALAPLARPEAP
ncbi:EamA family transporter [Erythrobacter arachoides]|uniref:EamA family transporter n=1 Tax=Aurantiacibacter arachoides TaxID=1850444 RepID=A0A845A3R4_9SPHN|nr:DMT family transporter [Aurantiacibacter arachoides]MXO92239.1 EamA family transporter [Aurantiacibacter arachoides]GGD58615.1 hypothetical protein GCM10011411_18520 [Aurantiacibacter arachoides]